MRKYGDSFPLLARVAGASSNGALIDPAKAPPESASGNESPVAIVDVRLGAEVHLGDAG